MEHLLPWLQKSGLRPLLRLLGNKDCFRKGVGLCHGISGNAYALIIAGEVDKCYCFVDFMLDHVDSLKHTPDRPYSLYEGLAGAVCLLSDILAISKSIIKVGDIKFPAYQFE